MTTLVDESDCDVLDDIEVPVKGDNPPNELRKAVHDAIDNTILYLLEGREIYWERQEVGQYRMAIVGGMPEMPVGPGQWVAPYRTREDFVENDGGLLDKLPDKWDYELKNDSEFVFYLT